MTGEEDGHGALPLAVEHLRGWYAVAVLALGQRTGLLDALLVGPGTAEEIAARADVDSRNAREWLGALTSAGHVDHRDGVYSATAGLTSTAGPDFPIDLRAVLELVMVAPLVAEDVAAAIRTGAGVPPDALVELSRTAGAINSPTYAMALVGDWLSGVDGLAESLRQGARIAELAPGSGDAAVLVGEAFPESTVVGWDVVPNPRDDLPPNVRLETVDARRLPDVEPFDLVYAIDSFHHFGDPGHVLAEVRRVLAPGGLLLLVEGGLTGDLDVDRQNPFAVIAYGAGLIYCLQENLAAGGSGRSGGDGNGWIVDALTTAGFTDVATRASDTGNVVVTARRPG